MYQQIEKYKIMNKYTSDNPLLIENPFGTNTTSIYLTQSAVKVMKIFLELLILTQQAVSQKNMNIF